MRGISLKLRTRLSLSGSPSPSCSCALLSCFRSAVFNQPLVDVDIDWGSVICSGLVACQDQTNMCLCVHANWCVCSLKAALDGMYACIRTQGKWSLLYPFPRLSTTPPKELVQSCWNPCSILNVPVCVCVRERARVCERVCVLSLRGSWDKGREARDCFVITLFTYVSSAQKKCSCCFLLLHELFTAPKVYMCLW